MSNGKGEAAARLIEQAQQQYVAEVEAAEREFAAAVERAQAQIQAAEASFHRIQADALRRFETARVEAERLIGDE